jgi:septum formation protein
MERDAMKPDSKTEKESLLILGSASPRRNDLLRQSGYQFRVVPPALHEPETKSLRVSAAQHAEALSYFKARAVAEGLNCGVILAADTVVAYGDNIFGKPADAADARRILSTLCGTTHSVITGVTVLDAATGRRDICHDITLVTMRPMPEPVLDAYIESGGWQSKAGAYGIQDHGDAFIERIDGSFTNVVGLPLEMVTEMLADFGIRPGRQAPDPSISCSHC